MFTCTKVQGQRDRTSALPLFSRQGKGRRRNKKVRKEKKINKRRGRDIRKSSTSGWSPLKRNHMTCSSVHTTSNPDARLVLPLEHISSNREARSRRRVLLLFKPESDFSQGSGLLIS
ncbi:hypothetical protein TNCV_3239661 [Trichonephila clavipes]|nr:hypothetical protein TNCV_3239661 [Trichonephila clavipes]